MRRLAALLIVPLALSACATYGSPGGGRYEGDSRRGRWYDDYSVPLRAEIVQSGGNLAVRLNRPAHVAIFEIVPGAGVGLTYPAFSREASYLPTGFSYLSNQRPRYYDWYHNASGLASRTRGEPRFYFLVASRRPLNVDRFQRSPGALRTVLGLNAYSALNHRTVMNDLVDAIVPYQGDDDWTTDLLAIWPDRSRYDRYAYGDYDRDRWVRLQCPDGRTVVVPLELYRYACGRSTGDGGTREVPPLRPDEPGDSSSVGKPGRRRPEPRTPTGGNTDDGKVGAPGGRPERPGTGAGPRVRPPESGEGGETGGGETGDAGEAPRIRPTRPETRPGSRGGGEVDGESVRETPRVSPRREEPPTREEPRVREVPRVRDEPRSDPPPRPQPRNDPPPARAEPRNDPPPTRAEPRNDPPPARVEPRSEPPRAAPSVEPRSEPRSRREDPS
jgi:hypothetical protein